MHQVKSIKQGKNSPEEQQDW